MRLIDADAIVLDYGGLAKIHPHDCRGIAEYFAKQIDAMPTIEPERRGKWIQNDNGTWSCDQCKSWIPDEQHYYANYCLYCGADMREGGAE